ncbi:MAG: RsmD family RNA methyltransferase [Bacteroidia bacterium]|nr:RsmD family RNA methyltransferase [Bacteroidia bacterium]
MRIISGKYRGKKIFPEKNFRARPTTDLAKESLFNILTNHFMFEKISALDLFSGTGSISYEFASRGCNEIIAIESDYKHYRFIRKMIEELKFEQLKVIKTDAFRYIIACNRKFDIIFADPPYDLKGIEKISSLIFENNILHEKGWLIIEHSKMLDFSCHNHFILKKIYSRVNFSIFS